MEGFFDTLKTIFEVGNDVMGFLNGILKYTDTVVGALKWIIDTIGGLFSGDLFSGIGDFFGGLF